MAGCQRESIGKPRVMTGQQCCSNGSSSIVGILKIGGDIGDGMPEYLTGGDFQSARSDM